MKEIYKPTKQQRINDLAWEIVDFVNPKNPVTKDIEDLEKGLEITLKQIKRRGLKVIDEQSK